MPVHLPVLQKEVIQYLDPRPDENFIDCTVGGGGHSLAILEQNGPEGKVLGIDRGPEMIENLKSKIGNLELKNRVTLVCDDFVNLKKIVAQYDFQFVHGILLDLGMSSWHLEKSGRGFSFQKEEPLDMRYNLQSTPLTAERIVNGWPEKKIARLLKEYSQEEFSKRIAKKIIETRRTKPVKTTFQLVEIIRKAVPSWYQCGKRIHPATKTFQALRIAVNDELENLERVLPQALRILTPGGRLVIISFHSLEDKIVKNFLSASAKGRGEQEETLKILTKKPIRPTEEEVRTNPRARSAKLRAAVKI